MEFLTLEDLLHVAEVTLGEFDVRDIGLLDVATSRPRASMLGEDAYPTLELKVASLVHSIARNHTLVDGNKRLALASAIAMLGLNGRRLALSNDEVYDLIVDIAAGAVVDVSKIAGRLRSEPL